MTHDDETVERELLREALGGGVMSYKCSWCEQTKDDYPAGSFTRVFDGYEPGLPNGRPIPKFVNLTNSRLCEACMSDPACTGEAMLKRIRAALEHQQKGEGL